MHRLRGPDACRAIQVQKTRLPRSLLMVSGILATQTESVSLRFSGADSERSSENARAGEETATTVRSRWSGYSKEPIARNRAMELKEDDRSIAFVERTPGDANACNKIDLGRCRPEISGGGLRRVVGCSQAFAPCPEPQTSTSTQARPLACP